MNAEFFNRLNEVQQAVTKVAMDKECSDILGTEFVQEFVGMQGTVIGQLNGMVRSQGARERMFCFYVPSIYVSLVLVWSCHSDTLGVCTV